MVLQLNIPYRHLIGGRINMQFIFVRFNALEQIFEISLYYTALKKIDPIMIWNTTFSQTNTNGTKNHLNLVGSVPFQIHHSLVFALHWLYLYSPNAVENKIVAHKAHLIQFIDCANKLLSIHQMQSRMF